MDNPPNIKQTSGRVLLLTVKSPNIKGTNDGELL